MIPILYNSDEQQFLSNGLGRLVDCISCTVTEERNGIYECEFQYPVTGRFYQQMVENGGIVSVTHDNRQDRQPFEIYKHSAPIDGIVMFNAHHISYRLNKTIVKPFTAGSCAEALQGLRQHAIGYCPFTFWTDKAVTSPYRLQRPGVLRSLLVGQQGSILDVYGTGEYEFDKFSVRLFVNRGQDSGVTIRYGKNLADINKVQDGSETVTAIAPFWTGGEDGTTVYLPEIYVFSQDAPARLYTWTTENGTEITDENGTPIEFDASQLLVAPMDFSGAFETEPSVDQLRAKAQEYLANNRPWLPDTSISVDFVQLWQTSEYKDVAALQRVSLCDTVSVYYPKLGVTAVNAKVVKTVYNVLAEKFDVMELGQMRTTLAESIAAGVQNTVEQLAGRINTKASFDDLAAATELLRGGLGGYVILKTNADGQPEEILVMDTPDVNTAVNVIRINRAGIGFSQNGYNGPFNSAWLIDGTLDMAQINVVNLTANLIQAGTMLADRIRGGTLTLGGLDNEDGRMEILDSNDGLIGMWDNTGLHILKGSISIGDGAFTVDQNGNATAKSFTADDFVYVSGTPNSYIKIPYYDDSQPRPTDIPYTELSKDGFLVAMRDLSIPASVKIGGQFEGSSALSRVANFGVTVFRYDAFFGSPAAGYTQVGTNYVEMKPTGTQGSRDGVYLVATGSDGDGLTIHKPGETVVARYEYSRMSTPGTKSRIVKTDQYANRLLYCYETPSPMFGDIGEGEIGEDGLCYIWLDPVFAQTISTDQYQVFLSRYGSGDCYVAERKGAFFTVAGTPGLSFGWEIKSRQADYDQRRLDRDTEYGAIQSADYAELAANYIKQIFDGRKTA